MSIVKTLLSLAAGAAIAAAVSGCAGMQTKSYDDYRKMVAARADAELVGNATCLKCHVNSKHGSAVEEGKVGCEDCHGPGSLAVKDIHEEKGRLACGYKTFINIGKLPGPAQSMICMRCHGQLSDFGLHNWNASAHNMNGVSCEDCHNVHHGDNLMPKRSEIAGLCFGCHQDVRAQFMLPDHHPVPEDKMTCTDCHNPHGSPNPGPMLVGETVKETCTRCHAEKEGPYVFEHADLMEQCTICHNPHGSQNDRLLVERLPFLCKQCHIPHELSSTDDATLARFGTNCTNCHSQIHGTDLQDPFTPGAGNFVR